MYNHSEILIYIKVLFPHFEFLVENTENVNGVVQIFYTFHIYILVEHFTESL